jgi:peptide-methionine (S)-S-oxide reductase
MAKATFGAGCFWGVEAEFRRLEGVSATAVGYAGGSLDNPTYEQVCSNATGHAEVVQVDFDPAVISYDELVDLFWRLHDPTQVNRQGPDVGTQYRSVIFTHDDEQAAIASASKERAQQSFSKPIATQIVPASALWLAEEYHQRYLEKKGLASCTVRLQQTTAS